MDVLGVLRSVGEVANIVAKASGKELTKRDLTLSDASGAGLELTLWGGLAGEFAGAPGQLLAIKGARVGDFGGRSLSSGFTSQMEVDPKNPAADALRAWLDANGDAGFRNLTTRGGGGGGSGSGGGGGGGGGSSSSGGGGSSGSGGGAAAARITLGGGGGSSGSGGGAAAAPITLASIHNPGQYSLRNLTVRLDGIDLVPCCSEPNGRGGLCHTGMVQVGEGDLLVCSKHPSSAPVYRYVLPAILCSGPMAVNAILYDVAVRYVAPPAPFPSPTPPLPSFAHIHTFSYLLPTHRLRWRWAFPLTTSGCRTKWRSSQRSRRATTWSLFRR